MALRADGPRADGTKRPGPWGPGQNAAKIKGKSYFLDFYTKETRTQGQNPAKIREKDSFWILTPRKQGHKARIRLKSG